MSEDIEKKGNKKAVYAIVMCVAIICIAVIYFCIGLYYSNHIFANVKINGTDVSNMTAKQIRSDLNNRAENYVLLIDERNGKQESIKGKDIDFKLSYTDALDEIFADRQAWKWGSYLFKDTEYNLEITVEYDSDKLESLTKQLSCMDNGNMEKPSDAYLEYDAEKGLYIVPEENGTKINKKLMLSAVAKAVDGLDGEINLDEAGVYVAADVTSDDKELNERYNYLKAYVDMEITYHFGDDTEVLDRTIFYDWMSEDAQGNIEFDQDMIKDYVKSLASKYNTAYTKHEFETTYGDIITINSGSYGWLIDQTTEREELYEALMAGESQDREPAYIQKAASYTGNDYGDTYVEVNLSAQHLFFYIDGEIALESDFVSGNASQGMTTPGGIFPITYKERNASLRGTPVSYWMPFNGNIGLHDSSWRSTYGKNIYKTNGSHGCINLPPSAAQFIYENIEQGMPVICYYLEGTEYQSDEKQTNKATSNETEGTTEQENDTATSNADVSDAELSTEENQQTTAQIEENSEIAGQASYDLQQ